MNKMLTKNAIRRKVGNKMQVELKVITKHSDKLNRDFTNYVINVSGYDFPIQCRFESDIRLFTEVCNQLAKKENK